MYPTWLLNHLVHWEACGEAWLEVHFGNAHFVETCKMCNSEDTEFIAMGMMTHEAAGIVAVAMGLG